MSSRPRSKARAPWGNRAWSLAGTVPLGVLLLAGCSSGSECVVDANCPETAAVCQTARCEVGHCVAKPRPVDTVIDDDDPNDCFRLVCDGHGGVRAMPLAPGFQAGVGAPGDCRVRECDGHGHFIDKPGDDPPLGEECVKTWCAGGEIHRQWKPAGQAAKDPAPGDCMVTTCDGLGHVVEQAGFDPPDDSNPCTSDTCVAGKVVHKPFPDGTVFADGATGNCKAVLCKAGKFTIVPDTTDTPLDGDACTPASCTAKGAPTYIQAPAGTPCGGERVCQASGVCNRCPVPDAACNDIGMGEPNDKQAQATPMGVIDDRDLSRADHWRCGLLAGPNDVDWYFYDGEDSTGYVDPGRRLVTAPGVRVCAFFHCLQPPRQFDCPQGTAPATEGTLSGCCGDQAFEVDLWCGEPGEPDDARVWIRVDHPTGLTCESYELRYHY